MRASPTRMPQMTGQAIGSTATCWRPRSACERPPTVMIRSVSLSSTSTTLNQTLQDSTVTRTGRLALRASHTFCSMPTVSTRRRCSPVMSAWRCAPRSHPSSKSRCRSTGDSKRPCYGSRTCVTRASTTQLARLRRTLTHPSNGRIRETPIRTVSQVRRLYVREQTQASPSRHSSGFPSLPKLRKGGARFDKIGM
ncbi:hypothetical protein CaCOL14_006609 [Colletotrichum acutatum]